MNVGDVDSCTYLFRMEDCVPPLAEAAPAQVIVFPVEQQVTITAQNFVENAVDDCSPVNWILYSWTEDIFRPAKTINCDSIAENGGPAFEFDIWVADGGVDRDCNGTISWNERAKANISVLILFEDDCAGEIFDGTILSENGVPVSGVTVSLHGGPEVLTTETDEDGEYRLPEIDTTVNYTVVPVKTTGVREGISTLDLIKIQKHLLGIEELGSPYKMIAADANNNSDVSAVDLLELRKLILQITSSLPNNTSWRFVPTNHVFADTLDPWPFPSTSNLDNLDFVGIKIGDINGTITQAHTGELAPYDLMIEDKWADAGQPVVIEVRASEDAGINGLQGTLHLGGSDLLDIESGNLDIGVESFAVHKQVVTFSWSQAIPTGVRKGDVLFSIVIRPEADTRISELVRLSSANLRAEAYIDESGVVNEHPLALEFDYDKGVISEKRLILNGSNPITPASTITYESPVDGPVKVWLLDFSGRTWGTLQGEVVAGEYLMVSASLCKEVPGGTYILAVEQEREFTSMKVILSN